MLLYKIFFFQKLIILIDVSEIEVFLEKGVRMKKHWQCIFQLYGVNSCIPVVKNVQSIIQKKIGHI